MIRPSRLAQRNGYRDRTWEARSRALQEPPGVREGAERCDPASLRAGRLDQLGERTRAIAMSRISKSHVGEGVPRRGVEAFAEAHARTRPDTRPVTSSGVRRRSAKARPEPLPQLWGRPNDRIRAAATSLHFGDRPVRRSSCAFVPSLEPCSRTTLWMLDTTSHGVRVRQNRWPGALPVCACVRQNWPKEWLLIEWPAGEEAPTKNIGCQLFRRTLASVSSSIRQAALAH